jgi:hypothetical protein
VGDTEVDKRTSRSSIRCLVSGLTLHLALASSLFDKLPDELVSFILSFVYLDEINNPSKRLTLLLNKRFKRLTDVAANSWVLDETTIPFLFRLPSFRLHPLLRHATLPLPEAEQTVAVIYLSHFLPSFFALTSLSVQDSSMANVGELTLPTAFTNALKSLKNLEELSIVLEHDEWRIEDDSFSMSELPKLRRLELGRCICAWQLLYSTSLSLPFIRTNTPTNSCHGQRCCPFMSALVRTQTTKARHKS